MNPYVLRLVLVLLFVGVRSTAAGDPLGDSPVANPFPPASAALLAKVQELFDEGFVLSPKRLAAAQNKLAAARILAPGDPRLDYAYGLVLLKQSQRESALTQFEGAIARKGPAYWPAWQALIWSRFADKQYEEGLGRLDEFAAHVRKSAPESQTTAAQREAAHWIGRMLEALVKTVSKKEVRDLIELHDLSLREVLGDDLLAEVEAGRRFIDEKDAEFAKQAESAREVVRSKQLQRKQSETNKLESGLKDRGKDKEDAIKGAEDWKKWLDKSLAESDTHLAALEKQYHDLELRAETISQSNVVLQQKITALETQMNFRNPAPAMQIAQFNLQQQMLQAQNQLIKNQYEYNAIAGQINQTAELGRLSTQQRAAIVEKYERETGELVKKTAALDKWISRVAEKKNLLEVQPVGKSKGPLPTADRPPVALKSYVPFDLDAERARVLHDYGAKPAAPTAAEPKKGIKK